ncbi:hypothetical protein [Corynebacterium sp. 13CS0277]|uniref:hypothetical protein n=1 Tax=Corynebacterium sp. 13CS0277 TaxID=2071994 RepID=UPI0011B1E4E8|nr:hypothetical protein [Corynebacterium sp. 13CS0277]
MNTMVWFRIDDNFHSHPKIEQLPNGAIGLWVKAGSWSTKYLTDGVIPASVVRGLKGTRPQIDALVRSGMWVEIVGDSGRKSYAFRDWEDYQTPRSEVMETRAKQARIKRESRANQTRIKHESHTQKSDDQQGRENVHGGLLDPQPHPLPKSEKGEEGSKTFPRDAPPSTTGAGGGATAAPVAYGTPDDPRCATHAGWPREQVPACGACGDARRVWREREQATRDAARAAVDACPWCNALGLVEVTAATPGGSPTLAKCDHTGPPRQAGGGGGFTPVSSPQGRRELIEKALGKGQ